MKMTRQTLLSLHTTTVACLMLTAPALVFAQDLTITNARIIVANGTVIERGSILVGAGKIVSVASGHPPATSGRIMDGRGMTAMPGFVDAHRHIHSGLYEKAQTEAKL